MYGGPFVSHCCCSKSPQISWLKTLILMVLELRSLESGCWQGCLPSRGTGTESLPLPFPDSRNAPIVQPVASRPPVPPFLLLTCPPSDTTSPPLTSCLHLIRTCDDIGPTWIIQDDLSVSRSLIRFSKSLLLCTVTYSQVWELGLGSL